MPRKAAHALCSRGWNNVQPRPVSTFSGVAVQAHAGGAGVKLAMASGRNQTRTDQLTFDARASPQGSRTSEVFSETQ